VDGTKGSLAEILWKRVIWLSQLASAVSKLTVLLERAASGLLPMLAELGSILLLKCIELALVTIIVIIVRLLGQMLQNFARWVVKVSWSSLGV
jgi:hypothetical protein